jgi:uncharacterized protein (TIGR02757 family)
MKIERAKRLARLFESLAKEYHNDLPKCDLMPLARHFDHPKDREIAAFFCATLSFGSMDEAREKIEVLLNRLGKKPARFLLQANREHLHEVSRNLSWQFVPEEGIEFFLLALKGILKKFVSLEGLMSKSRGETGKRPLWPSLDQFAYLILRPIDKEDLARTRMGHLVPRPAKGSQVERLHLFLKAVTRSVEGGDLGLWSVLRPNDLNLPLNARILSYARLLKLTQHEKPDRGACIDLSNQLRKVHPHDPTLAHTAFLRMIQQDWSADDLRDRFRSI